jgi:hypothetical protein
MPYRLPGDHERRALFAWLRRISSLAAWQRLLDRHQRLVDIVRTTTEEEGDVPNSWPELLLSNHAAMEEAVERLREGNRSCFSYGGGVGHFSQAVWHLSSWDSALGRVVRIVGTDFPPVHSVHWPEIQQAMSHCAAAYRAVAPVLEPRFVDTPAPVKRIDDLYIADTESLFHRLVRTPTLDEVPEVEPAVIVKSRCPVSVSGIWEPVRQRRAAAGSFAIDGCMNYLHAGSPAPTIACAETASPHDGRPTMWRLLWSDDRYGKNGIPEDEREGTVEPARRAKLLRFPGPVPVAARAEASA